MWNNKDNKSDFFPLKNSQLIRRVLATCYTKSKYVVPTISSVLCPHWVNDFLINVTHKRIIKSEFSGVQQYLDSELDAGFKKTNSNMALDLKGLTVQWGK